MDVEGFAAFGVTVKPRIVSDDVFEIWDTNWDALQLFLLVGTQWRILAVAGMGGGSVIRLGLDYSGVDVVMRRRRILDENGQLFADLQVMEHAATEAFGEVGA